MAEHVISESVDLYSSWRDPDLVRLLCKLIYVYVDVTALHQYFIAGAYSGKTSKRS
jgi:hypothetical protein